MSMLSIPSYKTDDPNYRYKMPRLVAKVEGRGNGIRTNIVNMGDIARALKRPADYPTKFCGHELGAQSKFDVAEGKAIVNGAHEQKHLQTLIDKFIDKFVLCQNCCLPEIDLQLKKGRVVYHCNACGHQGEVDGTHKLTTFILKNPPENADSTMGAKKKSKEERQREKAAQVKTQVKTREDGAVSDGEKKKDKKKKDGNGLSKEKKTKSSSKPKSRSNSDEDEPQECEGHQNGAAAAENAKKSSSKKHHRSLHKEKSTEDTDFTSSEGITAVATENLMNHMTIDDGNNKRKLNEALSPNEIADHLRMLQLTQGFHGRSKVFILLDVLFSNELGDLTPASLEKNAKYFFPISQNTSQRDILAAFEDFVMLRSGSSVPNGFQKFPYFLQVLYSADVLTEEGILRHYESKKVEAEGRPSYLKAKIAAQPFLTWLQQEDDSDSEDEEDEKVAKKSVAAADQQQQQPKVTDTTNGNDDSDVDIDDI